MGVPSQQDPDTSSADPVALKMIDWRDCPVIEYVPERVSGKPSFLNRRLQVEILVEWLNAGSGVEDFAQCFRIDMDTLTVAVEYLRNDPPVEIVDLAGCPAVELAPDGYPAFKGTRFPVRALFDFLKSGRSVREFSDMYSFALSHDQVNAVLDHTGRLEAS